MPTKFRHCIAVLNGRHDRPLALKRLPKLLRFVLAGDDWPTLDALDLLDDEPKAGERVIVAELVGATPTHYYGVFGGTRGGRWELWVKYAAVAEQPADEAVRDTARWRTWCSERQREKSS